MPTKIVLYHFWPSLCSQKVRLALAEKGVSYQSELINIGPPMENYSPKYARINPRMVVPTLVVDGEVLTDSAHILVEVDRRFAGPSLGANRQEVQHWIDLQNDLQIRELVYARGSGILGFIVRGSFEKRLRILRAHREQYPELRDLYQARIDDVSRWHEVSTTPSLVEERQRHLFNVVDAVNAQLAKTPFLAGPEYSLADVVWTVIMARLKFMGLQHRLSVQSQDYYIRMKSRSSFDRAQVWEKIKPGVMIPIVARVLAERIHQSIGGSNHPG